MDELKNEMKNIEPRNEEIKIERSEEKNVLKNRKI